MPIRKIFFSVCLAASALCLAAGFAAAGEWIGAAVAVLTGPGWLLARKYPSTWLPSISLAGSVGLAVIGIVMGCPPLWMICGSTVALAAWDLLFLDEALGSGPAGEQTRRYENGHLRTLALALGCGLLAAIIGRTFQLQIPFVLLILFIGLAVFGLERFWRYVK